MRKKLALILSVIFVMGMALQVEAAGSLFDCQIGIVCMSDGVGIDFVTNATEEANEIGCRDIILEEKVNGQWREIKISDGSIKNDRFYSGTAVYKGAVKGRTYRAHCTHYAIWGNTTSTLYNSTGEMVYN